MYPGSTYSGSCSRPYPKVRDGTLQEDACRVRKGTAPQVLAALRNADVHLLSQQASESPTQESRPAVLRRLAARPDETLALLGLAPLNTQDTHAGNAASHGHMQQGRCGGDFRGQNTKRKLLHLRHVETRNGPAFRCLRAERGREEESVRLAVSRCGASAKRQARYSPRGTTERPCSPRSPNSQDQVVAGAGGVADGVWAAGVSGLAGGADGGGAAGVSMPGSRM